MDLFNIEEIFFTLVKDNISNTIKTKYPNLQISTDPRDIDRTKFPTIYISALANPEVNPTLENDGISGIKANFQIEVYTTEKSSGKEVANEVIRILKVLAFYINAMPYTQYDGSTYRTIIRCNRVIGSEDVL